MRIPTMALLCAGCGIDPFETPSAYDQQHFLCEDFDALRAAADECRKAAEPCEGYISFQGQIQRVNLRVDTTLERGVVHLAEKTVPADDTGTQDIDVLSRVEMSGAAPYFHFDVAVSSIGTEWPAVGHGTHDTLDFGAPDPDKALDFGDGVGAVQWYIRAGSDTAMLTSNDERKGFIVVYYLSEDQVELRFAGGLGPVDDTLDACAIVFPEPALLP
jgi:hypothetical protein